MSKQLFTELELADMCLHLMGNNNSLCGNTIGIDGISRLQEGPECGYHVTIVVDDDPEQYSWSVWDGVELDKLLRYMGWTQCAEFYGVTRYVNEVKEGERLGGHPNQGVAGQFQDHLLRVCHNTFLDVVHNSSDFIWGHNFGPMTYAMMYRVAQESQPILRMIQTYKDSDKAVGYLFHYLFNTYGVMLQFESDLEKLLKIVRGENNPPPPEFRNQMDELHTFPKSRDDWSELPEQYQHLRPVTLCEE